MVAAAGTLLYSARMPADATVVKRARRRLFAAPREVPSWLRAIGLALFGNGIEDLRTAVGEGRRADAETPWIARPVVPRLVRDASGLHRCTGCGVCAAVCPGRCLEIEVGGASGRSGGSAPETAPVTAFVLRSGSCIGCSFCEEACPERAIEMVDAPRVVPGPPPGRSASGCDGLSIDLLAGGD